MQMLSKAKRIDNNEWIEGVLLDQNHIGIFHDDTEEKDCNIEIFPIIHNTICHYTETLIKPNKKIYTGDIVLHHHGDDIGIVRFGEYKQPYENSMTNIGFYVDWISGSQKNILRRDLGYWVNLEKESNHKIFIGNIIENPDLIYKT